MSKDYLDKWEERQKQNTEIIEQQQTKTKKMGKTKPTDKFGIEIVGIILTLSILVIGSYFILTV